MLDGVRVRRGRRFAWRIPPKVVDRGEWAACPRRNIAGFRYHVPRFPLVASLPELLTPALQLFGRFLLPGLQKLGDEDLQWLVHQEVDVFRHQDVGVDAGTVSGSGLLELLFDDGLGVWVGEEGQPAVTTEGDEVEGLSLLVSL